MSTRFEVFGMVQGVGFRWFVARHARSLGLTGHARNLPNGSVEVVVDGPEDAIPELERMLRSGPASAQVERVERSTEPGSIPTTKGFDVM
ncbi:MAG TPA: acylphosphatase [Gemmatimonadales bacterium]|nr:acylphosphatase [Gemmatimonadales bacterium]